MITIQVRIQDLAKGWDQLLRPKVADIVKQSYMSRVSHFQPGFRDHLRALVTFGFLMLKYVSSHILETLFLSFLAELFRGMLFKWKGENKKSHQKWDLIVNLRPWLAE